MKIKLPHKTDITEWHDWFAWWPIKVGEREWRWLEFVERKGTKVKVHKLAVDSDIWFTTWKYTWEYKEILK